jgi:hypothetical protein
VRARLRPDHGPVSRVVQMVGPFVIAESPGEDTLLDHYLPAPIETTKLTVSSRNGDEM